jgi:DNA-binding NarL/FixJ family response regulator
VAAQMRVFLVGLTQADLAALRARVRGDPALHVVGEALKVDLDAAYVFLPADAELVLLTREAAARSFASDAARGEAPAERMLFEELTPRESEVLALLSDGHANRTIAERLGVSEHTVKFHLASIYSKLGASTRTEAVRKGLDLGIIEI